MDPEANELDLRLKERFAALPPVVQRAITSADLEKRLRALADTHKLHLDQWEKLENEVMLALLGFQDVETLPRNIEREIGIPEEAADALARDINDEVFVPIREELERETQPPPLQEASAPASLPGTPPKAAQSTPAARAPISSSYAAQQGSHERKTVEGDPYREQVE